MNEFTVSGYDIIHRTATEHGNGAHVYVPKDWLGAELGIIRTTETDTNEGIAALTEDPFTTGNSPHLLTIGDRDSGIDYTVDRRALRWGATSETRSVIICDVSGKRQELVEAVNGKHIAVDQSETINPLNIKEPNSSAVDSPDFNSYRQKKNDVVNLLAQIIRLSNIEPRKFYPLIELLISKTYAKNGITRDSRTHHRENPTMNDFFETANELKDEYDESKNLSEYSVYSEIESPEGEDDLLSQLMNALMSFVEDGSFDHFRGETSFRLNEGGVTYLDINWLEKSERAEQAIYQQVILNHLNQAIRTFSDEALIVMDNSDVLIESDSTNRLEDVLHQWKDHDAAAWFLTDAPEYLTDGVMVTKRPPLVKQCQSIEFFPSKVSDEIAAAFGLTTDQAEFLRSEAKTGVANGEYSEGFVRQSDTSGWSRFIAHPSPIEDTQLRKMTDSTSETDRQ